MKYLLARRFSQALFTSARIASCDGLPALTSGLSLVERERRRQVAVGIDLREQLVGLLLDGCNCISACNPMQGRLLLVDDGHEGLRELGGIVCLFAAHRFPRGPGLGGALGVVVDRQVGVGSGFACEQLGAEEARLDDFVVWMPNGSISKRRDSIHPSSPNFEAA